jgi:arylsulfatase A-like enzyme
MKNFPIKGELLACSLFTGFVLPISYFSHLSNSSKFLSIFSLFRLYAVEWVIFLAQGLACLIFLMVARSILVRFGREEEYKNLITKIEIFLYLFSTLFFLSAITNSLNWKNVPEFKSSEIMGVSIFLALTVKSSKKNIGDLIQSARSFSAFMTIAGCMTLGSFIFRNPLLDRPILESKQHSSDKITFGNQKKEITRTAPNIVLITVDALSAQHMSMYGYDRETTPFIDQYFSTGIIFKHAYSSSNFTTPGISSILTGVYPWSHRAIQLPAVPNYINVENSIVADLKRNGYVTIYFGSNVWADPVRLGFGNYFDDAFPDDDGWLRCQSKQFDRTLICPALMNRWIMNLRALLNLATTEASFNEPTTRSSWRIVTRAKNWVVRSEKQPHFVWAHFLSPHDPYASASPTLGKYNNSDAAVTASSSYAKYAFSDSVTRPERRKLLLDRYDESIAETDQAIRYFIREIEGKFGDNTCVILTADHGESFNHNYGGHTGPMLYEELIHIPLMIRCSGNRDVKGVVESPVSQVDIAPTLANLAGFSTRESWEGENILSKEYIHLHEGRGIFSMNFEQNKNSDELSVGTIAIIRNERKNFYVIGHPAYGTSSQINPYSVDLRSNPFEIGELGVTVLSAPDPSIPKSKLDPINLSN